jgi:hypothetical protein
LAHQPFGNRVSVSTQAQDLNALLSQSDTIFGPMTIRAETTAKGQLGRIYVGISSSLTSAGVNAVGYLDPGDAIWFDQIGSTHTNAIFLVAENLNDKAYIIGITY